MSEKSIDKIVDDIIKRLREVKTTGQILHCENCHHEWSSILGTICDWCGRRGK